MRTTIGQFSRGFENATSGSIVNCWLDFKGLGGCAPLFVHFVLVSPEKGSESKVRGLACPWETRPPALYWLPLDLSSKKGECWHFWMHSFTCTNVKGSHLISPLGVIGPGYVLGPQTMISRGVRGGVLVGRPTDGWSERGVWRDEVRCYNNCLLMVEWLFFCGRLDPWSECIA